MEKNERRIRSFEEIHASFPTEDDVYDYFGHDPTTATLIIELWPAMSVPDRKRLFYPHVTTDTWGTLDSLVYAQWKNGGILSEKTLDAIEADPLYLDDPVNLPTTVPALRQRLADVRRFQERRRE